MSKQNKTKLFLDLGAFIALLISSAPHFTGDAIHEWLGIALSGAIIVHLLLNWNWILQVTSRLFTKAVRGQRLNYILNWSLFAGGIMIILSGLMISKTVVPFFGVTLPQNMTWKEFHEFSTNITMILMGLHMALHWSWIVNMFKKMFASHGVSNNRPSVPALSMQRKDIQS